MRIAGYIVWYGGLIAMGWLGARRIGLRIENFFTKNESPDEWKV